MCYRNIKVAELITAIRSKIRDVRRIYECLVLTHEILKSRNSLLVLSKVVLTFESVEEKYGTRRLVGISIHQCVKCWYCLSVPAKPHILFCMQPDRRIDGAQIKLLRQCSR